jgi:uncharacterized protein with HEPN domain
MRPEERDPGYVWDMLDAARSVREFTTGVTHDEYLGDRKLQLAVERALEIIGEAGATCVADLQSEPRGDPVEGDHLLPPPPTV